MAFSRIFLLLLMIFRLYSNLKYLGGKNLEFDCLSPVSYDRANCIYGGVISMFFSRSFNIYFDLLP